MSRSESSAGSEGDVLDALALQYSDRFEHERRRGESFKRVVILGHSGILSLEALRFLNDIGAALVHIDCDGNLIAAVSPSGLDDARLRRAQALAAANGVGLDIAKDIVRQKLAIH